MKLNYDELQYKQTQVDFFAGIPQPVYKKELQSFIGMVNYLSTFTPRLCEPVEYLHNLINVNILQWGPEPTEVFMNIK